MANATQPSTLLLKKKRKNQVLLFDANDEIKYKLTPLGIAENNSTLRCQTAESSSYEIASGRGSPAPFSIDSQISGDRSFIPTPLYRDLTQTPPSQNSERRAKTKIKSSKESTNENSYLVRHRPLELAERRERKREAELLNYQAYIEKLRREFPGLWDGRKT